MYYTCSHALFIFLYFGSTANKLSIQMISVTEVLLMPYDTVEKCRRKKKEHENR